MSVLKGFIIPETKLTRRIRFMFEKGFLVISFMQDGVAYGIIVLAWIKPVGLHWSIK